MAALSTETATPIRGQRPTRSDRVSPMTLLIISLGGACGALARYGIGYALPTTPTGFPWATFLINATGCLVIGAVMVLIPRLPAGQRLIRPFLSVGVLGGYTTFSTYTVDVYQLINGGVTATALAYLVATPVIALLAVALGTGATRWSLRVARPATSPPARASAQPATSIPSTTATTQPAASTPSTTVTSESTGEAS